MYIQNKYDLLSYLQTMIDDNLYLVGSTALFHYGLIDSSSATDLDIRIYSPSDKTLDKLEAFKLMYGYDATHGNTKPKSEDEIEETYEEHEERKVLGKLWALKFRRQNASNIKESANDKFIYVHIFTYSDDEPSVSHPYIFTTTYLGNELKMVSPFSIIEAKIKQGRKKDYQGLNSIIQKLITL